MTSALDFIHLLRRRQRRGRVGGYVGLQFIGIWGRRRNIGLQFVGIGRGSDRVGSGVSARRSGGIGRERSVRTRSGFVGRGRATADGLNRNRFVAAKSSRRFGRRWLRHRARAHRRGIHQRRLSNLCGLGHIRVLGKRPHHLRERSVLLAAVLFCFVL